jgi:hypothetical protein
VGVTVGILSACAVTGDSTVLCWGTNNDGRVGDGTTVTRPHPVVVPGLAATRVALGGAACAERVDGAIACWGTGSGIGNGHWPYAPRPVDVAWRTTPRLEVTLDAPANAGTLDVPVIITVLGDAGHVVGWYADPVEMAPGPWWWDPQQPNPVTVTLPSGDAEREIHGWVRDDRDAWSPTAVVATRIDTTRPEASASLPAVTRTAQTPLEVTATDAGSGVEGWLVSDVPLSPGAADVRWADAKPTSVVIRGADGVHRVYVWTKDAAGNVSLPSTPKTLLDTLPPYGGTAPVAKLRATTDGGSVPVRLSWSAARDAQPGVIRYLLAVLDPGATAYRSVALVDDTATAVSLSLRPGTYRFRVRAVDRAGNPGPWLTAASPVVVRIVQESSASLRYTGAFRARPVPGALGGTVRYARGASKSVSLRATARGVSFVSTRGPNRGKAEIWLDGARVATIDLYAAARQPAQVVWSKAWGSSETHTVKVRMTGTKRAASTSTRVDIDAFLLVR